MSNKISYSDEKMTQKTLHITRHHKQGERQSQKPGYHKKLDILIID